MNKKLNLILIFAFFAYHRKLFTLLSKHYNYVVTKLRVTINLYNLAYTLNII